jgi:hypothetical protein
MARYDSEEKNKKEAAEQAAALVEVIETEEADDNDLYVKFASPYKFEGKTYEGLDLSGLYDLTGKDYIDCERYCKRKGSFEESVDPMKEFSMPFVMACACRATDKPIEFFERMSIRNLVLIKNAVVGFLYGED